VDYVLVIWARWMRGYQAGIGFRNRSVGLETGGNSQTFDAMCEDADRALAKATNAAIEDLPPAQECAIHNAYLGAVWRFPRDNYAQTLEAAKLSVVIGLRRRHLWTWE